MGHFFKIRTRYFKHLYC